MIDKSNKEIQSHYDFIVVGAGAAGSVLAAELSASGAQVLVIMALGHVLGGGSSINAMVWTRGLQRDYDGWAENGAKGWSFADVLPVFKSQEDWEGGGNAWRGAGGPIHIRRPKD